MKSLLSAAFAAVLMLAGLTHTAKAGEAFSPPGPDQGPVYATTYYEVSLQNANQALAILKEYRDAARRESGAVSSDLLQEVGHQSRFVVNEVWQTMGAYTTHTTAAARTALHLKMRPIEYGPPDTRLHVAHYLAPGGAAPTAGSIVIMSHLDVTPNGIPSLIESMKSLSEGAAKDAGMQKYQILRQFPGAGNHFRLYENWASDRAADAHSIAAHTIGFRANLMATLGTPYDQRRYQIVN